MAVISLQLFTGQLIDVDTSTDFSLKSENPFFSVGITEMSHTQDFSVPATQHNNQIFNVDNSVIMQGWRRGRDCWLGYSSGEIAGKLFIKDYNKERYNVLFIWGAELDDVLSQPIINYLQTGLSLSVVANPTLKDSINDFGWCNYSEVHFEPSFSDGLSLMPTVNLGWLMDQAAIAAGYKILMDGDYLVNNPYRQYNAYNYGININTANVGDRYHVYMSNWAATGLNSINYQTYDDSSNPVADVAAGFQLTNVSLWTNQPGVTVTGKCFRALRNIKIRLQPNNQVICMSINGIYLNTEGNGGQFPYIEYDTLLYLTAGQSVTFVNVADFDYYTWAVSYDGYDTPFNYDFEIIDSSTVANLGDSIDLDDNLPDYSLLELVRNWCLMTSSFFEIDAKNKQIIIRSIEAVLAARISNKIVDIDNNGKILDVGQLRRYIEGYSQHNLTRCNSADYVAEVNRFGADYPCDNDLLDDSSEFGVISFNDGNISPDGEAIFKNVEPLEGGGVSLRPSVGVFMFNTDGLGGHSYHLQYVENNYGMHNPMAAITTNGVSIVLTVREQLAKYLAHTYDEIYQYGGCMWIAKDYTWKDNATQFTLVKVDDAIAQAETPINYLSLYSENGTVSLVSNNTVAPHLEYSTDYGNTWNTWGYSTSGGVHTYDTILLSDITIYLKGNNPNGLTSYGRYTRFIFTGDIYCYGDCGTLINSEGGPNILMPPNSFRGLFESCSTLKTPPELPALNLSENCYRTMFYGTGIVSSPVLPAKNLVTNCYYGMFQNSASLVLVTTYADMWDTNDSPNWLAGVGTGGVLRKKQETVIPTGWSGIPYSWTTENV